MGKVIECVKGEVPFHICYRRGRVDAGRKFPTFGFTYGDHTKSLNGMRKPLEASLVAKTRKSPADRNVGEMKFDIVETRLFSQHC